MSNLFLTAEWRKLVLANYVIEPGTLQPLLPAHTELDLWEGKCFVSLVGFLFKNVVIKGCRIPFHTNFEEVNLRFYVKRRVDGAWRRGVVFISEYVPLRMVTLVANNVYEERYATIPMKHSLVEEQEKLTVQYKWKKSRWHSLSAEAINEPQIIGAGSEAEFITQHFWGYSQKRRHVSEYEVAHELWKQYAILSSAVDVDFEECYGRQFAVLNHTAPSSLFLAEGSAVQIFGDRTLK